MKRMFIKASVHTMVVFTFIAQICYTSFAVADNSDSALSVTGSLPTGNKSLNYYLPANAKYQPQIPTPESVLGFQVGQWHARHDQVITYMQTLAERSDRVSIIDMGMTWEQRPQILVVITSPENQARLDELISERENHKNTKEQPSPLLVWLGYSIHGNEASGTNASMLSAYHFAANTGAEHKKLLEDSIILIEPSLNPDGYGRFSTWANNNRSLILSSDPSNREHMEDWPNGRTNHYRFDLNRDWLLAQQPESKVRLTWFHKLRPHVLGDFHEMDSDGSYFFQPGVPSRQNPLTPPENFELTDSIAKFHAKSLDEAGSLYYSKQSYDDYYYGKGSTYPDINGGVGILFEQASARGHLKDTINGPLSFPFAIKNHFLTSLSTVEGANALRDSLIDYQQSFYDKALTAARNDNSRAVVVSDDGDSARAAAFIDILLRHKINVYKLKGSVNINGLSVTSGMVIPFNQRQYRLIKSLFETRTRFTDNTFYDVSSWNLPYAFNLPFGTIERKNWKKKLLGAQIKSSALDSGAVADVAKVAYAFDWNNYNAPAALNRLLVKGLNVRVAAKSFTSTTASGKQSFAAGTIVIPSGIQAISKINLHRLMQQIAKKYSIQISAINSGYSLSGIDMGSGSMAVLEKPRPLMLTGSGISAYDSGELWYLLDRHLEIELTQGKLSKFAQLNLKKYSHLILTEGDYQSLTAENINNIKKWIEEGGVLVAMKSASRWTAYNKFIDISFMDDDESENFPAKNAKSYDRMDIDKAQNVVGGSIFSTKLDITHPLAYGYQRQFLPVFRNHTMIMNPSKNPYATVARYDKEPLLSGFVSNDNLEKISTSAMMVAERKGKGSVILILDNPVFRGFWYGSSRLFINSLFFGRSFQSPE